MAQELAQEQINAQMDDLKRRLEMHKTAASAPAANGAAQEGPDAEIEELEIDPSEVSVPWEAVRSPVEVMSIEDYQKGDSRTYLLVYRCLAGPNAARYRKDWLPKAGGGLAKTFCVAEAIGLRDPETGKVKFSNRAAVVGKRMWVNVIMAAQKTQDANGNWQVTHRDEIEFPRGYDPIDAFDLPLPNDPFAEGEPVRRGS